MKKNANYFLTYALLFLMAKVITGCSEEEKASIPLAARKPSFINSSTLPCEITQRFAETSIGPDGTLSCIVIDSVCDPGLVAKKADNYFKDIANLYRENAKTELFAKQGILIFATQNKSLIQLRVGEEHNRRRNLRNLL